MFVIVYCGYEGIDSLMWAGTDADEARAQVAAFRERCRRVAAVRAAKRYRRLSANWMDKDDPDRVCVMAKHEYTEFLTCCCALLDTRPSKLVLM